MNLWLAEYIPCAFLTGLILTIHFIHYPTFRFIKTEEFKAFVTWHGNTITPIVFPAMLAELIFAILLFYTEHSARSLVNLASVLMLWAITGLKSSKTHSQLIKTGFSLPLHRELLRWNQVRTILWSLRFIGISAIIFLNR